MTVLAPQPQRPGFEALGFDPAPGQLGNIERLVTQYTAVSQALHDAHAALTTIGSSDGIWQGQAAEAFRGTVGELPGYLDKAHRSLGDAGRALQRWQADLTSMQHTAAQLEARATQAQQELQRAESNPDLNLAGQHFPDDASLQAAQQRLDAATSELRTAQQELEVIREQARRLAQQHADLADQVAEELNRARDIAPEEPGFFERLGETLGRALDEAVEAIRETLEHLAQQAWQVVEDNANLIAAVSDVLADLSAITGLAGDVLSLVPYAGPVLDVGLNAVSIGLGTAALGGHSLAKAAGADVPWTTLAFDAAGIASGVYGLAPGPGGAVTDVALLAFQGGVEAGSGSEVPTFWGDLQDYWVPKNVPQAAATGAGVLSPPLLLVTPFWNAIEQGHQKDVEARENR